MQAALSIIQTILNIASEPEARRFFEAGLNFTKESGYFVVSALEAKFLASAVLGDEVL